MNSKERFVGRDKKLFRILAFTDPGCFRYGRGPNHLDENSALLNCDLD